MNSGDGYLGMYNETELNVDNLNLNNLTASNGTITTLNSTTATLTTANITTGNITSLNTNSIQASPVSSAVSLYTTHTGTFTLGNISNTNNLTINSNIILGSTKKVISNSYQPRNSNDAVSLLTEASTSSVITLGGLLSTLTINPPITCNGNITMASAKNISLSGGGSITVSAPGKIACYDYQSTSPVQGVGFASTNTTSSIYIGEVQTTGNILLGHTTPASDSGTLFIQKNTTVATGKKITTPAILVSGLTASKLVLSDASKNIISSAYDETSLPVSTPQQTALNLKANINAPVFTTSIGLTSGNLTISSGKILNNTYTGLATSSNISIGESGNTGNLTIFKDVFIGQFSPSIDKALYCKFYIILDPIDDIYFGLYQTTGTIHIAPSHTTGDIFIGNYDFPATDTGVVNFFKSVYFADNKNLALGSTNSKIFCNVYTGTATSSNITIGVSGDTGNLSIFKTIASSNTYSGTNTFQGGNTHSGSNTFSGATNTFNNTILVNTLTGTATGSAISLYGTTTSTITLGATTGGNLTINPSVVLSSGKNISLSSTGKVVVDTVEGIAAADAIVLFSTTTSTITLGNTGGGNLTINPSVVLATGKNLTISSTGKIVSSAIDTNSALTSLSLGWSGGYVPTTSVIYSFQDHYIGVLASSGTTLVVVNIKAFGSNDTINLYNSGLTTGTINLGGALTTGSIILGRVGQTGVITCNTKVQANTIDGLATSSTIVIGGSLTSGVVNISNTSATGTGIALKNKFQQNTATASAYWNVAIGSANNIFQSSVLVAQQFPPVYTNSQLDGWCVWESNAAGEGSFFAQNGETSVICNPGDKKAFHWVDEDLISFGTGFNFNEVGVMTLSSDSRLKTNIKPLNKNNLLNKLHKIDIINYSKIRPDGITRPGADEKYARVHTGYTAQQLLEIGLDEFVIQPTTPDGYMSVSYGNIQFLFNAGVQELIKENRQQQKQIDDLTSRLTQLEQIILNLT